MNAMPPNTAKENASGEPSSQLASSIAQRSRLRRTLLFAGVFALLAMLFVPTPEQHGHTAGYRWIFDRSDTSIAFFQLLLNVGFAALVGALVANFSRRTLLWTARIVATAAVAVAALVGFAAFQQQMKARAESEETTASFLIRTGDFDGAKARLLKASNYWWWKGWWEGARRDRERAFDQQGMERDAAFFRAESNEARAKRLLEFKSWNNVWHYPNDENVKEAKQLLLAAAEAWHIIGNTAHEQRLRVWENNVKTEREFSASLPDQPSPSPTFNPDAYLASKEEEKLIHDPIDYQRGKWTTGSGEAFVVAKFFERNLGDRKGELDALADQLGAQKRYILIEKQKRGGVWWVRVYLYRR